MVLLLLHLPKLVFVGFKVNVGFSGKTWATDSSVINRYPTSCSDTFSSPNVYRNAASNYMGLIKNHHTDVSDLVDTDISDH